jgi:glycine oxidase
MSGATTADVAIAGGGIIGLSLGLELLRRGLSVTVVERGRAMNGTSHAAAGMLAVHDAQNPPELLSLSVLSGQLYPEFLERVEELSGCKIPLRTGRALQHLPEGVGLGCVVTAAELAEFAPGVQTSGERYTLLEEVSLDPRDLCVALPLAFAAAGGTLIEQAEVVGLSSDGAGVALQTASTNVSAGMFVNCCGAWAGDRALGALPVYPIKGQMGILLCPPQMLRCVVRSEAVYLVPRGDGRIVFGATIEEVGFDEMVEEDMVRELAEAALRLLPCAGLPTDPEMWAGLRPATPDGLPILGPAEAAHCWHATGHYRNGILLGPGTARVMAQAVTGEATDVPLEPFSPARF